MRIVDPMHLSNIAMISLVVCLILLANDGANCHSFCSTTSGVAVFDNRKPINQFGMRSAIRVCVASE
jgi:hypothetical protein